MPTTEVRFDDGRFVFYDDCGIEFTSFSSAHHRKTKLIIMAIKNNNQGRQKEINGYTSIMRLAYRGGE